MDQHIHLPAQILPLIHDFAGKDALGEKEETLTSLATSYLHTRQHPTRLAFNTITDILAVAREQGFGDNEINHFLAALERTLRGH